MDPTSPTPHNSSSTTVVKPVFTACWDDVRVQRQHRHLREAETVNLSSMTCWDSRKCAADVEPDWKTTAEHLEFQSDEHGQAVTPTQNPDVSPPQGGHSCDVVDSSAVPRRKLDHSTVLPEPLPRRLDGTTRFVSLPAKQAKPRVVSFGWQ